MKKKDLYMGCGIPYSTNKPLIETKYIDGNFLIEINIYELKKSEDYPDGVKYSLVVIDLQTKQRILGLDNHEKKGHHFHKFGREFPYNFIDKWKLMEDFYEEYENIKKRLKNEN